MPSSNDNEALLQLAVNAALSAGGHILQVYDSEDFDVSTKGDGSPLTRADRLAHDAIVAGLAASGLPVLSEEGKSIAFDERSGWARFWMVDPLDGTKEFVKRNGEFTVNIALIEDAAPVLGVVYAPARKSLYVGVSAVAAYRMTDVEPEPIDLRVIETQGTKLPAPVGDRPYKVVGSRSHGSKETADYVEGLKKEHPDLEMLGIGSSLKLCMVAEGAADVYPRFAPTMEWDTAAAHAVVLAAGKRVQKWLPGEGSVGPVVYNKEDLLNPWFLVSD
jgi:3'(2'), 5'-bisphosphate nucleotidase